MAIVVMDPMQPNLKSTKSITVTNPWDNIKAMKRVGFCPYG